ncbi:MAG TPA: cation:proton antiporter, partial [Pseudorhodoferax sp.]|nr:cation:proton antiporter [Pseudorhodoferax sp.]
MLSGLLSAPVLDKAGIAFIALLIVGGFLTLVALCRAGIRYFWSQPHAHLPALPALELLPVALLLAAAIGLTIGAGPVMQHAQATAEGLFTAKHYRQAVLTTLPVPAPPFKEAMP